MTHGGQGFMLRDQRPEISKSAKGAAQDRIVIQKAWI